LVTLQRKAWTTNGKRTARAREKFKTKNDHVSARGGGVLPSKGEHKDKKARNQQL